MRTWVRPSGLPGTGVTRPFSPNIRVHDSTSDVVGHPTACTVLDRTGSHFIMNVRRIVAKAATVALVCAAWVPWVDRPSETDRDRAVNGVKFERLALPDASSNQRVRPVQPSLKDIAPWISSVGASVAAMDLRQQGVSADGCLTDPRDDKVRIFPVPGGVGKAFPPFELEPIGLAHDRTMAPIGCVPADVDADGRQDIIVYYWGRSPVIFYNRVARGSVPQADQFRPTELVSPAAVWNTTALNVADVDGDGRLDVLVGNYFPDGAKVLDPTATDDARMQMQHSMGDAANAGANRLFLSNGTKGDGTVSFSDASATLPARSAASWTLAFGAQDLTGNGLPDIYVANDFGPDQLLVNTSEPGQVRLNAVSDRRNVWTAKSKSLGNDSFKGMGVVFSYENGASLPRIFVSNITSPWALQESNLAFYPTGPGSDLLKGEIPYREESASRGISQSGWAWDIKALDVRNEGTDSFVQTTGFLQGERNVWPRLQETAMQNDQLLSLAGGWLKINEGDDISGHEPDRLWRPTASGQFVDAGDAAGFRTDEVSRGLAVSDVNNDGLDDVMVARQWQRSYAYINRSESMSPWVTLRVVRNVPGGVTPAIGAKVTITSGTTKRSAQLYPANGHSGVSGTNLHFALPQHRATDPVAVDISWRDANGQHTKSFTTTTGLHELRIG